jgi:NitT/TauT family transport system substrate-binding protein
LEGGLSVPIVQTRRRLATYLSNLAFAGATGLGGAGAAGLLGVGRTLRAEPLPETTEIRLKRLPIYCEAPQYIAEELLRAQGVTSRDVPPSDGNDTLSLARGDYDLCFSFASELIMGLEAHLPITVLGGVHVGCFELFGSERIRTITDLKNRTVGIRGEGLRKDLVTIIASYIGLDPVKDIRWVSDPEPMKLFAAGKIDAFVAVPPETLELRARNIGHVILNSSVDRPWSQYFCCMLTGNRDFVLKHPVVTKLWLKAVLKGTDLCASEPRRVAKLMVERGIADRYDYALQTLNEVPYGEWRDFDPEDTLRFYALRLHEAGSIKSSPQTIIAEGTDWRFLNELKRELKI